MSWQLCSLSPTRTSLVARLGTQLNLAANSMSRVPVIAKEVAHYLLLEDTSMQGSGTCKPLDSGAGLMTAHLGFPAKATPCTSCLPLSVSRRQCSVLGSLHGSSHLGDVFGALSSASVGLPVQLDLLLLEVSPILLVHEHQVEVVLHAELVVDQLVGGRQVVGRQKQPASKPGPDISAFIISIGPCTPGTILSRASRMSSAVLSVTGPAVTRYSAVQCMIHS